MTAKGIMTIIDAITAGGAITVGSGGILSAGGISIIAGGIVTGVATATYGSSLVYMSASNYN